MLQPQVLSCDEHDLNDLAKLIAQQTEIIIPLIYFQSMFCCSLQMLVVSPFNHGVSLTASTPPLAAPLSPLPALQIILKIQKYTNYTYNIQLRKCKNCHSLQGDDCIYAALQLYSFTALHIFPLQYSFAVVGSELSGSDKHQIL